MRSLRHRRTLRPRGNRSGQAIVEFTLIVPILFLIIFGLIDFARGWSAHHAIADASREGTRMLVVDDPSIGTAESSTAIKQRLAMAGLDSARVAITYTEGTSGQPTTVRIEYPFDFWLLGVFMSWMSGEETVTLVSQITMRTE